MKLLAVKPIRNLPRTRLTHWAAVQDDGSLPKLTLCKRSRAGEAVSADEEVQHEVSCHRCNVTKLKNSGADASQAA